MLKKSSSFVLARHSRLTISAAFTNVPRLIQRGVNLRRSTYGPTYASPLRHRALTDSRPSAYVTLIILRVADLPAALPVERRVSARRDWAGEMKALFEHPAGYSDGNKS